MDKITNLETMLLTCLKNMVKISPLSTPPIYKEEYEKTIRLIKYCESGNHVNHYLTKEDIIKSLPTSMEIDKLKPYKQFPNEDYHRGYESGIKEGAKNCRNKVCEYFQIEPVFE